MGVVGQIGHQDVRFDELIILILNLPRVGPTLPSPYLFLSFYYLSGVFSSPHPLAYFKSYTNENDIANRRILIMHYLKFRCYFFFVFLILPFLVFLLLRYDQI